MLKFSLNKTLLGDTIYFLKQDDSLTNAIEKLAEYHEYPISAFKNFKAGAKESAYFPATTDTGIYLLGVGKKTGFKEILDATRSFIFKNKTKLTANINVSSSGLGLDDDAIEAICNGLVLGLYNIGLYKTHEADEAAFKHNANINFASKIDSKVFNQHAKRGQKIGETQSRIFDLVNAPSNKKTPKHLAQWAQKSGKEHGYEVEVLEDAALKKKGLHAILAVGQGSKNSSALIISQYAGHKDKKAPYIALVGKGITFDTGGVSLKVPQNMHYMKSDMGGAAAVLGAVESIAKLKLPVNVIGIVASAENAIDQNSINPGDVINSYSGKTIEVIDTDAEGRLVLADAIAYVNKNYKPITIIDLATLTGSVILALGYNAAGLFTNNPLLAHDLSEAGNASGEKVWQMPIWDSYDGELKSDVADIKNLGAKPVAGSIIAAKFLEFFIDNHQSWAHLDIAGVAFSDNEFGSMRNATAFGVRLLTDYISNIK